MSDSNQHVSTKSDSKQPPNRHLDRWPRTRTIYGMNAFVTVQNQQNNSTQIETASRLQMTYSCSSRESSYQIPCNIISFRCFFATRTCQQTITLPRNHRLFQMDRKKVNFRKRNQPRQRSLRRSSDNRKHDPKEECQCQKTKTTNCVPLWTCIQGAGPVWTREHWLCKDFITIIIKGRYCNSSVELHYNMIYENIM